MFNSRLRSFNYAISMFGKSIPINMPQSKFTLMIIVNYEKIPNTLAVAEIE